LLNLISTSHANVRSMDFTQPIHKSNGQFLLIKINLSKFFV
jgi:hypothetical protein